MYFYNMELHIDESWLEVIGGEFDKPYFKSLIDFVSKEYELHPNSVFPKQEQLFRAFNECLFDEVKVVIIGQDPYPTRGHAHGLCFSVSDYVRPFPKSLNNIFKEIESDLDQPFPLIGSLEHWAKQGVLLLNSVLTVREGEAGSHSNKGWEQFTDAVIEQLNARKTGVVYLLWGSKAIEKAKCVDSTRNCILTSVHPSPLSAYRGFFGCKHFSMTNQYLQLNGKQVVNW